MMHPKLLLTIFVTLFSFSSWVFADINVPQIELQALQDLNAQAAQAQSREDLLKLEESWRIFLLSSVVNPGMGLKISSLSLGEKIHSHLSNAAIKVLFEAQDNVRKKSPSTLLQLFKRTDVVSEIWGCLWQYSAFQHKMEGFDAIEACSKELSANSYLSLKNSAELVGSMDLLFRSVIVITSLKSGSFQPAILTDANEALKVANQFQQDFVVFEGMYGFRTRYGQVFKELGVLEKAQIAQQNIPRIDPIHCKIIEGINYEEMMSYRAFKDSPELMNDFKKGLEMKEICRRQK